MPSASAILTPLFSTAAGILVTYLGFVSLLTIPTLQDHVIYLHKIKLTWSQDVNVPEQWGFLRNQVTPFQMKTPDGETLHAWHILPLETYHQNAKELKKESTGLCEDIENRLSFKLLKEDPTAQLVIYFHGAAGTLGSGWRPQSYRALSAAAPNVHVLAIDYRGFGSSTGWPSEPGLLTDALTLANFALDTAGIPPERIVVFAQSLGTAIAMTLAHTLALRPQPVLFAGMVLVAPMADIETTTRTYKIAGTVPLISPMAIYPPLLAFLNKFIVPKWPSKNLIAGMIGHLDTLESGDARKKYDITMIHAEDDWDMPWSHTETLFLNAVHGMRDPVTPKMTPEDFVKAKEQKKVLLDEGGWEVEWRSVGGIVREKITKYGLHDRIMSYPIVSLAVANAFKTANEELSQN